MRDGDGIIVSQIGRVEYRKVDWSTPLPELSLDQLARDVRALAEEKGVTSDMVSAHALYELLLPAAHHTRH